MEIILQENDFEFTSDKLQHQTSGTAIGIKAAPPYANIFMSGLEHQFVEHLLYKRFL